VAQLKIELATLRLNKPVTGIFEASVAASLLHISPTEKFGIVSTGEIWRDLLTKAVEDFLGIDSLRGERSTRFAGVATTGLNATDLHDAPAEEVRSRMKEATKELVSRDQVGAICLGCAGMAGMNEVVRDACVEALGSEIGQQIKIVDGVQAGVAWLDTALRT
jgi:Asp/Glu/hydantoin racemase